MTAKRGTGGTYPLISLQDRFIIRPNSRREGVKGGERLLTRVKSLLFHTVLFVTLLSSLLLHPRCTKIVRCARNQMFCIQLEQLLVHSTPENTYLQYNGRGFNGRGQKKAWLVKVPPTSVVDDALFKNLSNLNCLPYGRYEFPNQCQFCSQEALPNQVKWAESIEEIWHLLLTVLRGIQEMLFNISFAIFLIISFHTPFISFFNLRYIDCQHLLTLTLYIFLYI